MGGTLALPELVLPELAGLSEVLAVASELAFMALLSGVVSLSGCVVTSLAAADFATGMGSPTLERTARVGGCRKRRGSSAVAEV